VHVLSEYSLLVVVHPFLGKANQNNKKNSKRIKEKEGKIKEDWEMSGSTWWWWYCVFFNRE
jgi:hypothetical protein